MLRCVFRYERLEEQLNDLTELHQNEMTNLKQELASMEEKVAYQSYERARDIQVKTKTPIDRWRLWSLLEVGISAVCGQYVSPKPVYASKT